MIRNEKYYLLFCSVLFCSIESLSGCRNCCERICKCFKNNEIAGLGDKNEIVHRYVQILKKICECAKKPSGYFFINEKEEKNINDQKEEEGNCFYIPEDKKEIYSCEKNLSNWKKVKNKKVEGSPSFIFYNSTFDWTTKDFVKHMKETCSQNNFVMDNRSDFLIDSENTIYLFDKKCVAKITENEFLLCDNETSSTCEIFSQQEKCQKEGKHFFVCFKFSGSGEKKEIMVRLCLNCSLLQGEKDEGLKDVEEKYRKKYQTSIVSSLVFLYDFLHKVDSLSNVDIKNGQNFSAFLYNKFGKKKVDLFFFFFNNFSFYLGNKNFIGRNGFLLKPLLETLRKKWQLSQ